MLFRYTSYMTKILASFPYCIWIFPLTTSEGWVGREFLGTVHSRIPCDHPAFLQDGDGLVLSAAQQYCPQKTFLACLQPSLDIQNIQQPSGCHNLQGWLYDTAPLWGLKLVNLWAMYSSKNVVTLRYFLEAHAPIRLLFLLSKPL